MKKFLVLYMANAAEFEQMMQNSTPEQRQKGMEGKAGAWVIIEIMQIPGM